MCAEHLCLLGKAPTAYPRRRDRRRDRNGRVSFMVLILGFGCSLPNTSGSSSTLSVQDCTFVGAFAPGWQLACAELGTSKCLTARLSSDGVSEPTPFLAASQPSLSARIAGGAASDSFCEYCYDYHGTHSCVRKPVQNQRDRLSNFRPTPDKAG